MARSTFQGPILSGDSRFGPIRDVGYAELFQQCTIDFSNTGGNGTAGYPGGSGQFVNGNLIPNVNAVVYTNSATAYPPTAATITADTTSAIYRGVVMYVPVGCTITDFLVDYETAITITGTTPTYSLVIGNAFNTSTYGSISSISSTGRQSVTMTGAELLAMKATGANFTNPTGSVEPSLFSQVVFTFEIAGGSADLSALSAGVLTFGMRYIQPDNNIGTTTTYPYGNFD